MFVESNSELRIVKLARLADDIAELLFCSIDVIVKGFDLNTAHCLKYLRLRQTSGSRCLIKTFELV